MKIEIPRPDWHRHLVKAINVAKDGDIIVCHNRDMLELAESARQRMCPEKMIFFDIEEEVF